MPDTYVIKMPQLSDTMTEGVVVSWEKNLGDKVERGDIVATVETDKAIMDVEVFRDGYLSGPLTDVDSVVPVGGAIAYLVSDASAVTDQASAGAQDSAAESSEPAAEPASVANDEKPAAASHVIKMPQLSDTMTEGVVVSWEKSVGDKIERGDVVATVETDKAIMDVEVFREGYLSGPMAAEDSVLPVGAAMAYLVDKADETVSGTSAGVPVANSNDVTSPSDQDARHQIAAAHPAPGHKAPARQLDMSVTPAPRPDNKSASPYARQVAAAMHVNLNPLKGSGANGVIVAADVMRAQPLERPSEVARQTPAHIMPEVQVPGHGRSMTAMERAVSHRSVERRVGEEGRIWW